MQWMGLVEDMKNYMIYLAELHNKNPKTAEEIARKSLLATGMWTEDGGFIGIDECNKS